MIRKHRPKRPEKKDVPLSPEDMEFVDQVAVEIMKIYVTGQRPKDFSESMMVSRIAYRQALAMINVKKNHLKKLILESGTKLTI